MAVALTRFRPKWYYGWYIVAIGMLGTALGTSTSQLFMSIVVVPMTEDLGWSRTAASGAITLGTFASGILAPFMGRLADRYGARWLTSGGAIVVCLAQLGLALMTDLWQFYAIYLIGRSIGATTIAGVVPNTAVTNWFRRKRGRALGFVAMSLGIGASTVALVGQLIIEQWGWRTVFVVFGLLAAFVVAPPAALLLRRRPEDLGLLPDGATTEESTPAAKQLAKAAHAGGEEPAWSLSEALRTPALWLVTIGITFGTLATGAVTFQQVPYYTDIGIAATVAALALSCYALAGAFASALWGFLSERFSERYLAVFAMALGAAVVFGLLFVRGPVAALIASTIFGIASRGETALVNMILAQYYGRRSYGAISGFVVPFQQAGLGFGPLAASLFFDFTGGYHVGFLFFSGVYVAAAVLFWLARAPVRREPATAIA